MRSPIDNSPPLAVDRNRHDATECGEMRRKLVRAHDGKPDSRLRGNDVGQPRIHGSTYGHDESNGIRLSAIGAAIPPAHRGSRSARRCSDVFLPGTAESSDPQPVRGYL